jgi:cell division protein FtsB
LIEFSGLAFFLLLAVVGLIIAVTNLLRQINQLEGHIQALVENQDLLEEEAERYYTYMLKIFVKAQFEIERIDKRGAYSSDDEVGFAFNVIKHAIQNVRERLEAMKKEGSKQADASAQEANVL